MASAFPIENMSQIEKKNRGENDVRNRSEHLLLQITDFPITVDGQFLVCLFVCLFLWLVGWLVG